MISVFDLFSVGIGPSSSHTVGPMRAARTFVAGLKADGLLADTARIQAELFGSLGATGHGHGSDRAVLLGLAGEAPETVDTDSVEPRVARIRAERRIGLLDAHEIDFDPDRDLVLHRRRSLPYHPNGMTFAAYDSAGEPLRTRTYYSVGGGFVVDEAAAGADRIKPDTTAVRYPFSTGGELLAVTRETGLSISEVMLANELSWRSEREVRAGLLEIWRVMRECVTRGCERDGVLPGGLKVRRRAAELYRGLMADADPVRSAAGAAGRGAADPLRAMDWVTLFALAVNEENAAGGRVVTAPTNGAAGIIPAVLHYYDRFSPGASEDGVVRFLLAAGAIGVLFKENASISGAEVGCQGEVGSACSMAAAGLAEALGGTPEQVENAAEIGMEHNLGLTCDPVGGLVQIPCIERNAVASIKAITAARLALRGDGVHAVSLDKVIKTMRETGADMKVKYKETARGGLAVNVIEC
ncbi:L-serine ammonia-lyase [Micromonospora sp. C28SCA-DRY-2]|uniref:L-serine ammonia-lyase n=1 Tax=Micromonospora sp. C28SCA-DRY-2 TaxID=3059522 RepID=UPI002675434E|nr:L-serine ammonia-lyase [Micromonospora sp. C28SCA-DRY-2]MDO3701498.1 L-serine ammonia-lyase [Micromonospora sp. C28SCA-DRY-2]